MNNNLLRSYASDKTAFMIDFYFELYPCELIGQYYLLVLFCKKVAHFLYEVSIQLKNNLFL